MANGCVYISIFFLKLFSLQLDEDGEEGEEVKKHATPQKKRVYRKRAASVVVDDVSEPTEKKEKIEKVEEEIKK